MTSSECPPVLMSTPAELIEAVPYLLGFHPGNSLVVLGFRRPPEAGSSPLAVAVATRIDLDPAGESGLDQPAAAAMLSALDDCGCEAAAAVLFPAELTGDPRADPDAGWLSSVTTELLESAGIRVLALLLVHQGRWWSLHGDDAGPYPADGALRPDGSSLAAELDLAGMVARPDRSSLLATLDGRDEAERATLLPALHRADQRLIDLLARNGPDRTRRTESSALVRAAYECEHGTTLSRRRLARLGAALRDHAIRDGLWAALDTRAVTATALLSQLHSALPSPYDAAPMFLAGWASWRAGNGTLATEAADRAQASDPEYSAAPLLIEVVQTGMDPYRTPPLTGRWT